MGRPATSPSHTVMHIVGARPNFVKLAPVEEALRAVADLKQVVVHTGQHYDAALSDAFFRDLELPEPDFHLGVGSGSHALQTGEVMKRLDKVLDETPVGLVLVYGDVNSTVAAALVAAKRGILVGHVEAGLRSRDWTMPEEVNRVVTDRLSDFLFTPSRDAEVNLRAEGVDPKRVHFVGNVMVDTLLRRLPQARALKMAAHLDLPEKGYGVVTLHRPSNVDEPEQLRPLLHALSEIGRTLPLVFPTHPRTQERLRAHGLGVESGVKLVEPLAYLEMLSLVATARGVITDSGGLQEETTVLGVPCVTVRANTERPVTITNGTNRLALPDVTQLPATVAAHFAAPMAGRVPELWDGKAGVRIATVVEAALR